MQFLAECLAQTVKHLPTMWETWVRSLGREDPLEKKMATHSSISCLENPMDRGVWWTTVHGAAELDMSSYYFSCIEYLTLP